MLGVAAALVAGAAVLYMLLPIIQGQFAPMERAAEEPDEVKSQRRVILKGIRDAEYDFVTGKLDEDDYRTLKAELAQEAFELIDEDGRALEPAAAAPSAGEGPGPRGGSGAVACRSCGARVRPSSRFCSECGTPVGAPGRVGGGGSPSPRPA